MAETKISWTDYTYNPWIGCWEVSPACLNCYAKKVNARRRKDLQAEWVKDGKRSFTKTANDPLRWNREAHEKRKRYMVFCLSMGDVFEDHPALVEPRRELFELIRETKNLDWQLLTKRPENIMGMLPADWGSGWPNVWMGATMEKQEIYDRRIKPLLEVPAKVHFISAEPLLEPLQLKHGKTQGLDWIIVGGESGAGFRPMDLSWVRGIHDDSQRLGVTFFFKQVAGLHPPKRPRLDGVLHHNWPTRPVGRPSCGLSRSEQMKEAQRKFREKIVAVPIPRELVSLVDQKAGIKGRGDFVAEAIRKALV